MCKSNIISLGINMKRLVIRTFISSSSKNISINIETDSSEPIENQENNHGNNSLC